MARSVIEVPYKAPFPKVKQAIDDYLEKEGYHQVERMGETCFQKGASWWSGVQVIKCEYGEDRLRISGWVEYNFFALKSRSAPLHGWIGAMTKAQVKYRVDMLAEMIPAITP